MIVDGASATVVDAVCDAAGHLKAFGRMDGAWLGSIDVAMGNPGVAAGWLALVLAIEHAAMTGKPQLMATRENTLRLAIAQPEGRGAGFGRHMAFVAHHLHGVPHLSFRTSKDILEVSRVAADIPPQLVLTLPPEANRPVIRAAL